MEITEPPQSVGVVPLKEGYSTEAKRKADKIAARKSRNSLEVSPTLEASLNTLNSAWIETSGGDNTISGAATLYFNNKDRKKM